MNIQEQVKKWVLLDNQNKKINDQLKLIRSEKNELSANIFEYFNNKEIKNPNIKISDGKLNITNIKQANIISYKFLEECFDDFFDTNKDMADELLQFIKNKRNYTTNKIIKRTYN